MANQIPQKSIRQSFLELPEKVRDWLTSERATYTIIEINKKLDLFGNLLGFIPDLITRLVTKDLDPKDFTKKLENGLGLDSEQAQEVTREIVEKILRPVDLPLKETGVFIGLIYGLASSAPSTPSVSSVPSTPPLPNLPAGRQGLVAGEAKSPTPPTPPATPQRPVASTPPTPPISPKPATVSSSSTLTRQSGPPLIQTREAAHPTEERKSPEPPSSIQSKVIPIPIKRPMPPNDRYGIPPTP